MRSRPTSVCQMWPGILVVLLDCHFDKTKNIKQICKESRHHLKNISRIRNVATQKVTLTLVHPFITTTLDYTVTAWGTDFLGRPCSSFSACRTRLLGLSHELESSIAFIFSCPQAAPPVASAPAQHLWDLDGWLSVRCMACHQMTSQACWSPASLLALCVLREGTCSLCRRLW